MYFICKINETCRETSFEEEIIIITIIITIIYPPSIIIAIQSRAFWLTRLVLVAISAVGLDAFDCSLCVLNHSAPQHVNEAIHRRVTSAPSCFERDGRESLWVVPARAKRASWTFDAPCDVSGEGGEERRFSIPYLLRRLFRPARLFSFFPLYRSRRFSRDEQFFAREICDVRLSCFSAEFSLRV